MSKESQLRRWEDALWIGGRWGYSRRWQWRLAWIIDAAHELVIPAVGLAPFALPRAWGFGIVGTVMLVNGALGQCALSALTSWLRTCAHPDWSGDVGFFEAVFVASPAGRVVALVLGLLAWAFALGWLPEWHSLIP